LGFTRLITIVKRIGYDVVQPVLINLAKSIALNRVIPTNGFLRILLILVGDAISIRIESRTNGYTQRHRDHQLNIHNIDLAIPIQITKRKSVRKVRCTHTHH